MAKRSRETSLSPSADGLSTSKMDQSNSDSEGAPSTKFAQIDDETASTLPPRVTCSLPPHRQVLEFQTYQEHEIHYAKEHTNRCSSCGKNFPSARFLGLHIDEHHNPLREELALKGDKTYSCFVDDCDRRCSTPQKRRRHMIDKHGFPKVPFASTADNQPD